MKKITWTAFITFWAATFTLVIAGLLAPQDGEAGASDEARRITMEELAEHASRESCWQAIRGKVYDLTGYIPEHPTPPSIMLEWCGKVATEAYATKGYGRPHSPAADAMLEQYYIGELAESRD